MAGLAFLGVRRAQETPPHVDRATRTEEDPLRCAAPDAFDISTGSIRLVAAPVGDAPLRPNREALRRHHRLMIALAQQGPFLPARFGARFAAGLAQARAWAAARQNALAAQLDAVSGCVEIGYRVELNDPQTEHPKDPATPTRETLGAGARFLRGRRAMRDAHMQTETRLMAAADRLRAGLAPLMRDMRETIRTDRGIPRITGAVLVPAVDASTALARITERSGWEHGVRLAASGPFPVYSFADIAAADASAASNDSAANLDIAPPAVDGPGADWIPGSWDRAA